MKKKSYNPTILISHKSNYISVIVLDIFFIEACGNNVLLYMRDKSTHTDSKRIGKFLLQLDPELFFRTHKKFIVNISAVEKIEKARCGEITMRNGSKAKFSEEGGKELRKKMKNATV